MSRITVRRALADLAALGLVERRHGRGTFITGGPQRMRPTPSLSYLDSLREVASETEVSVVSAERVASPSGRAAPLIKLVRLSHDRDARPVQHLTTLLPPERSRILMDIPGDKINTLDAGHIVHDTQIDARG